MLATLTDDRFSSPDWIYERKLDGVRALAFRSGRSVRLMSRNRKEMNGAYPELVDAIRSQTTHDCIVDGEIVAFEGAQTSFARLQGRMKITDPDEARKSRIAVYYYLFDLLHLDGRDVTRLPLRDRKRLLRRAIEYRDPLRFAAHRNEIGQKMHADACERGWEGIIAKRADSRYTHSRSRDWLKFKCVHQQELVIGGFTDPEGSRPGFGALLLGVYDDGKLRYAGRVGTGFDDDTLRDLAKRLKKKERDESPFSGGAGAKKGVHWVEPALVAEIGFTEWTRDARLRHPRFLGLRRDKPPRQVHRESPA
ncbi:MAG: non-homologous end-joining DNA ligase [Planctomycetota bacterium]|nr:non-homologous end-joining DNA ligase [Planctomycetota bacterium]